MPEYSFSRFVNEIDRILSTYRVYFFYGENNYYIHKTVEKIVAKLAENVFKETIYSWEIDFNQLTTKLVTPTLFGKNVVVVLRHFEATNKKVKKQIIEFLQSTKLNQYFIILYEATINYFEKADQVISSLLDLCVSVNFVNLTKEEILSNFIPKKLKLKITESAKQLIYENTGNDLWLLSHELEKISYYVGNKKEVVDEDVIKCCSAYNTSDLKDLIESIQRSDYSKSLQILNLLLDNGVSLMYIFTSLHRYFLRIAEKKQYNEKKFFQLIKEFYNADYKLKTTRNGKYVLEITILNLCNILKS